ncbi:Uma2 family endonuclease [Pseudanabaena sp. FACHB-1998]|uniref:Uma2 family endonuclease n=1 Tax=Pseudanabaena sp. FACHB-1998 TaxID=2692858 RepID=UPI00168182E9|nr:Uma2 family endonuclease [Pseudanabaena sp. FACHB-1998]MBD2175855.1 Uma2 family endonuclease [Pseudanabaena sp. FACHB-1998]
MTTSLKYLSPDLEYPSSDGLPMAESDPARDYLVYGVESLTNYFQNQSEVYVSGNLFIYYEQGNPKAVVAPDVFVVIGATNKKRLSYKVWEENYKMPDFVLEVTSKSTVSEDQGTKKGLYAYLGIKEYFQYDPTSDYLKPSLQGFRLIEGNYLPILSQEKEEGLCIFSQVLGLDLCRQDDGAMRFYQTTPRVKLLSHQELAQAKRDAEDAQKQAEIARQQAEIARQRAEVEKLAEQQRADKLADKLRQLGLDPDSF